MTDLSCSKDSDVNEDMSDTLCDFGYRFLDGKLKNIKTGEPFQFVVKEGDHSYNQKHYEALGEVITDEVYKLLETECSLQKCPVPYDAKDEPSTFIFKSEDALTNPDRLLVLIHGSGVVRAGQWARRLIINDSLESGTQIPFIKKAQEDGYGVLVLNTNDNSRKVEGKTKKIRGSESPEAHAVHVWENYVKKAEAKHIAIIAHSFGGCVTTALFQEEKDDFRKRVFAVAMTDSVHFISHPKKFEILIRISCNWVSSERPLDTPLSSYHVDIKRVSAGVNVHEKTSWSSFESVFKFLEKRYNLVTKGEEGDTDEEEEEGAPLGRSMSVDTYGEEQGGRGSLDRSMSVGTTGGEDEEVDMRDVTGAHAMSDSEEEEEGKGGKEDHKKQKINE